jgi:hypothetical protein
MSLYLNNRSSETINVCLLLYDPSCTLGGQPWRKVAWYVISPGNTILPDVFYNVDLTKVNGWIGVYAYTASGDKDWQGTGNAWFRVSDGVHFNQCGEDETNTPKWVDFEGVYFGWSNIVVYIGPAAKEITATHPQINVVVGSAQFFISGAGFVPGTTVSISYNYVYDGNLTSNTGAPSTVVIDSAGNFSTFVGVSTLFYDGNLSVQAVDTNWGLSATDSLSF